MTEKANIVMVKVNTATGEDMALSIEERFKIWQEAVEYADTIDNGFTTVVVAPEYFLVTPAIKRSEVVSELKKFYGEYGITPTNWQGDDGEWLSYRGQMANICTILGIESSNKVISAVLDDYQKDYPEDDYTYYMSSRALPEEVWQKYKAHFKNELDTTRVMLIPGTSVYKKKLKDKKPEKLSLVEPWNAQLSSATAPDLFKKNEHKKNLYFINKLAQENEAEAIRNRAMVIMPNEELVRKFYKHVELSEITGTLITSGNKDAEQKGAFVGEDPDSKLYVKGKNILENYVFESGKAKLAIEICADHMNGVASKLYKEAGLQTDCHVHFILSATCEHIAENLLLVDGGILIHCDADYNNPNKFGVFRKSFRDIEQEESKENSLSEKEKTVVKKIPVLTPIAANVDEQRYSAWLAVDMPESK